MSMINFEVDLGSAVTTMSEKQFAQIFPHTPNLILNTKLVSFCNTELVTIGYAIVNVTNITSYSLNIARTDKMPLLGCGWIRQLQLIKFESI